MGPPLPPDTASRYGSVSDARLRVPRALAECRGSSNSAGGDGAGWGVCTRSPARCLPSPAGETQGTARLQEGWRGSPIKAKGTGSDALGAHSLGFALRGGERVVIQSDAP